MLKAENVSYTYQEVFNLERLSLEVGRGEIVGIIGHSGSGKSTLLHLLAGLKEPAEGHILVNQIKMLTPSKKLVPGHEKVKLVTQQNTLFPNISVFDNIAYELRYYEKEYQKSRVESLSESLNIGHLLRKLPRELSGGEIQRVMIAKALADEPWILLLDEPMANLDRIHKKQVMLNLAEVVEAEKIACIMVTHDIFDAFGMADRLVIMHKGSFVQQGPSEEIYHRPYNKYVAELTGDINAFSTTQLFRPEDVSFSEEGVFEGKVKKAIFQGGHFDLILETGYGQIIARSEEAFQKNETLHFNVKSFIHFDEN